jgi:hypothetical protein
MSETLLTHGRDGQKYSYSGPYVYNQSLKTWSRCLARAKVIYETIRSIKNKDAMDGLAQRWQAEAMTLDNLTKVIQWSESQCPPRQLTVIPMPNHSMHILGLNQGDVASEQKVKFRSTWPARNLQSSKFLQARGQVRICLLSQELT